MGRQTIMGTSRHTNCLEQKIAPTFGVIFAGETASQAAAYHCRLDGSSFICQTNHIRTEEDVSTLDVSGLGCVFVIADLESACDLVNAAGDRLRNRPVFHICIALGDIGNLPASPPRGDSDAHTCESMPIVSLVPSNRDSGCDNHAESIGLALHLVECIARSVLDGRIVGVCLNDLFHYVFHEGHGCTYRFEVCSFSMDGGVSESSSFAPPSFARLQLSHASAALVVIETPEMPEMQVRRMAKDSMNAVRKQMRSRADCLYAATINNTLVDRYLVSVLAMERKAH